MRLQSQALKWLRDLVAAEQWVVSAQGEGLRLQFSCPGSFSGNYFLLRRLNAFCSSRLARQGCGGTCGGILEKELGEFIQECFLSFARSQGLQHTTGKSSLQQADKMIKATSSGGRPGSICSSPGRLHTVLSSLTWSAASLSLPVSAAAPALALASKTCKFQQNHTPGIHPKGIWGNTPWQLNQALGCNLAFKQSYLLLHFNAEVHNLS